MYIYIYYHQSSKLHRSAQISTDEIFRSHSPIRIANRRDQGLVEATASHSKSHSKTGRNAREQPQTYTCPPSHTQRMADERQRSAKVTISQSIANKCNLVSNIELPAWAGGCQHANTMHTVAVPAMGALPAWENMKPTSQYNASCCTMLTRGLDFYVIC